jgi:hypothetical protein
MSRTRQVGGWGRRRLLMILAAVALMIVSLIFGLIMVAHHAATQVRRADDTHSDSAMTTLSTAQGRFLGMPSPPNRCLRFNLPTPGRPRRRRSRGR